MQIESGCFSFEKSVVLNALYDTIDRLGFQLDSANSFRGTLIVSERSAAGRIRIALDSSVSGNQTQVSILPQGQDSGFFDQYSKRILEELLKTIQMAQIAGNHDVETKLFRRRRK